MKKTRKSEPVHPVHSVHPVRYPAPTERLGSLNPLDGLFFEGPVAAGFTPASEKLNPAPSRPSSVPLALSKGESQGEGSSRYCPPPLKQTPLTPIYRDDAHGIWLYHENCLTILDAIYAKYGDDGRFDMIFADPPYFLSNGGITCHAGKMVKVDKGAWDKSRGPELNHEFNTEWLRRCQRVLRPNGTIWVTGTHHVIFSVGYRNLAPRIPRLCRRFGSGRW